MKEENRRLVSERLTKYRRWTDPGTGESRAFAKHPLFHVVRGAHRRKMVDVEEWQGREGWWAFGEYLRTTLPRPSRFHDLKPIEPELGYREGNLAWIFVEPKDAKERTDHALELAVWRDDVSDDMWSKYGGLPMPDRDDFGMPERNALDTHLRSKWLFLDQCLCSPLDFFDQCGCGLSLAFRYGDFEPPCATLYES